MTGSSLAPLIIPIAGTLGLTAWLALVFHCGRPHWRTDGSRAPGHESPGPAALVPVLARHPGDGPPARHAPAKPGLSGRDLHVIFEVEQ